MATTSTSYVCQMAINYPIVGNVLWTALIYNTNGISTNGVVMLVNTNDQ